MRVRRSIWGICWLLSLVVISFYGGAVSYGIFFGLTLIPLISLIYIFCVWYCHKIYQEIGSRNIVCGQPVPYYFVLQNESRFAFAGIKVFFFSNFSYVERLPGEIEYELLPGQKYKYETSFVCKYRGEYEVGIKEIVVSDFFGLFCLKCAVRESKKVLVAPKLIKIDELKSISDISVMMQRENQGRPTELDIVSREYAAGDALKQIHWKTTAREGKLMSRRTVGEEKQGIALFFDTCRCDTEPGVYLPVENRILEIVLALSLVLVQRNIPVSVFYAQHSIRQRNLQGIGDMEEFYQQMKDVTFDKAEDMHVRIESLLQNGEMPDKVMAFFVLHKIDYDVLKITHQLAESGTVVIFYVVTDENIEEFGTMGDLSRRIIAITPEEELEEVL